MKKYLTLLFLLAVPLVVLFLAERNQPEHKLIPISSSVADSGESDEPIKDIPNVSPAATPTLSKVNMSVWLPYWDSEAVVKSLTNYSSHISSLSPMWYRLNEEGNLQLIDFEGKDKVVTAVSASGLKVIPTISNDFDAKRVRKLISDPQKINEFVTVLLKETKVNGFAGWDIDWEEIYAEDKSSFTEFIKIVSGKLHAENLVLTVTLPAKRGIPKDWSGTFGFDYAELGKYADEIRIMAYDFHNSTSTAGPITPLEELSQVIDYTLKVVNKDKIVIGLPLYGYDWVGSTGTSVEYERALSLSRQTNAKNYRDADSGELVIKYENNNEPHEVWFQDIESVNKKLAVVEGYGIKNVIFWRLGGEDIRIWLH